MRSAAVALVLLVGGCGASGLAIANGTALGVSSAALACDWGQTRRAAEAGWKTQVEHNPIMGPAPDPWAVDAYFAGALILSTVGWYALPRRWRIAASVVVIAIQVRPVYYSATRTSTVDLGVCGIR